MIGRIRLISGLIMFAFVISHFLNHALGLVSLAVAEDAMWYLYRVYTSRLGRTAIYGAFLVHFLLALYALWQRRTLRLSAPEAVQYTLGFFIPLLLTEHVMATRVSDTFLGGDFGYYRSVLTIYFYEDPWKGVLQGTVLVVAWLHACIGLRFWLRLKPWYESAQPYLYAAALLIPVLALLGVLSAGKEVIALAQNPDWLAETFTIHHRPPPEGQRTMETLILALRLFFVAAVLAVLLARVVRHRWRKRHGVSRVTSAPQTTAVPAEGARKPVIIFIVVDLPAPFGPRKPSTSPRATVKLTSSTATMGRRVQAGPEVRLACQLRPTGDIKVTPLLPPFATARDGFARPGYLQGGEREIAILFADLRAFTRLAETRLPYDVVFLLNRYFAAMGRAVEEAGGHLDKFIGDGVMALFGIDSGPVMGCRQALHAARLMSERLVELNKALENDLGAPLRIGIGLHFGATIVGEMGYGKAVSLTAVGDAVNTASRLENATKEYGCELVVSEDLVSRAGIDLAAFPRHELAIRGREQMLVIRTLASGRDLPVVAAAKATVPA